MRSDELMSARAALQRGDWSAAHEAADRARPTDPVEQAQQLELQADALWWLGRLDECIAAREAAYRAYGELGDAPRAGQCAVWLYEHHCFRARPAIAGAWLRRARRSLASHPECVEHGALVLREAEAAHGRGELDDAAAAAAGVVDLARRLRSPELEAEALQTLGRVRIDQGDVREGLAHLDEAMLFAVEGRLGPYATGKVYCSLISACEELGDLRRAAEWTEATAEWSRDHPLAIFPGICRVHRASVLTWRGELAAAEREAERACSELAGLHLPNAAAAHAEVGDIRRRLGDLPGAEAAFGEAEALCGGACAGLALLRLAQERVEAAVLIIDRCLDQAGPNRLARARALPAHVQVHLAAGDTGMAQASVSELEDAAAAFDSPVLIAGAWTSRGRLLAATGDLAGAATALGRALSSWQLLGVPYEVATTRTLLGEVQRRSGDGDASAASFAAAEALFDGIGARIDALAVVTASRPSTAAVPPAGLTAREAEVLALVARGHTNREIAAELYISDKTVSRHLSNIFTKLEVSSRAAATAFAVRSGVAGGPAA